MSDADLSAAATSNTDDAGRGPWVWVWLALWILWLGAMIFMSSSEWGKPKPKHVPDETPQMIPARGAAR